jgi:hypothetical protein
MRNAMDVDGSGCIEFAEFRLFMARLMCGTEVRVFV